MAEGLTNVIRAPFRSEPVTVSEFDDSEQLRLNGKTPLTSTFNGAVVDETVEYPEFKEGVE
jgi:hypothetical protein